MSKIGQLYNEKDLLIRLMEGDQTAFDQLYRHHANRIYGKLLKFTKSAEVSEELLQDLFMKVWEKRDGINPALPFKSYLFRIAEHLISDYYRRAAKDRKLYDHLLQAGTSYERPIDEESEDQRYQQKLERLQEAIEQLPPKCKEVYTLIKIAGKSYQEVAAQLGISAATISNQMTKANQLIRAYLNHPTTAIFVLQLCLC